MAGRITTAAAAATAGPLAGGGEVDGLRISPSRSERGEKGAQRRKRGGLNRAEYETARVLVVDVLDYVRLRAVCAPWRASAPSPRDPTLRDSRYRPRGWVALCDGDGVRPADACEVAFFHTVTGRCLRARLPELGGHRIVGFTDGLLILLNKATTAVRVLHPFTRVAVDLPPIAAVFTGIARDLDSRAWMKAAVCQSQTSPDSIAVVAWFPPGRAPGVVVAEPSFSCWHVVHHDLRLTAAVPFQGRLYGVTSNQRQLVQVYPERRNPRIAHIPTNFGVPNGHRFFLLESAARLMLVLRYVDYSIRYPNYGFALFEVDTNDHGEGLAPVSAIGDRALFLSHERCLSVSRKDLPSIAGDAIYFYSHSSDPVIMHCVSNGRRERTSTFSIIYDGNDRVRPSVRPFTLADQLLTYCYHRHWSRGLMFHEYHEIPTSDNKLCEKLRAQDREVKVPRLGTTGGVRFQGQNFCP
ncbi:hypothetical protein ACP70R_006824 [Stipagrostis hirtigluma subsp. patula]